MWMFAPAFVDALFTNELGASQADQNPDVIEKSLRKSISLIEKPALLGSTYGMNRIHIF
jgi:hypothetical protein